MLRDIKADTASKTKQDTAKEVKVEVRRPAWRVSSCEAEASRPRKVFASLKPTEEISAAFCRRNEMR